MSSRCWEPCWFFTTRGTNQRPALFNSWTRNSLTVWTMAVSQQKCHSSHTTFLCSPLLDTALQKCKLHVPWVLPTTGILRLRAAKCDDLLICFKRSRFQIFKILWKNVNPHAGGTYKSLSLQGASCSCQLPVYCRSSTGQCRWDNFSAFAQLRPNETSFNRCMAAKLAVRKAWVTLMTLG